jgi:predicted RNase H-like HicB family nuclease
MNKTNDIKNKALDYYLKLKYPVTIYPDSDGGYVSEIKDLPGCFTQGETLEETLSNIEEARELWLETAYEYGDEIPLPSIEKLESDRLSLQLPPDLHQKLLENARRESISLDRYIIDVLNRSS